MLLSTELLSVKYPYQHAFSVYSAMYVVYSMFFTFFSGTHIYSYGTSGRRGITSAYPETRKVYRGTSVGHHEKSGLCCTSHAQKRHRPQRPEARGKLVFVMLVSTTSVNCIRHQIWNIYSEFSKHRTLYSKLFHTESHLQEFLRRLGH